MRRPLIIILLSLLCFSCLKNNKIDKTERSLIWPLKIGNYWQYKGVAGYADGGTHDTSGLIMEIDSIVYFQGNEYYSAKGYYDQWYRSAKGETWQANAAGDDIGMIAKNVNDQSLVIHNRAGTYKYFTNGDTFNGTLIRIAVSQVVSINKYNCTSTEEIYVSEGGDTVQKKIVYYSTDKGPICYKYFGNAEAPGSRNIYQTMQYTLDSLYIQE